MNVKITGYKQNTFWYSEMVGSIINVLPYDEENYIVDQKVRGQDGTLFIDKEDCIITEEKKSIFADKVEKITDEIAEMLISKNQSYGNSAGDPLRIFSKSDADEGINVRIDDKLSRISRGKEFQGDDTILDLIGYLVLKLVLKDD